MTRSLIVGMDDTGDSRNALARAAELARAAGLRLVVAHVRHIPVLAEMPSMTIGPARQNLDLIQAGARRAAEDVLRGTGVDWEFVVRSGAPAHELMAIADDRPAAAIVVGPRKGTSSLPRRPGRSPSRRSSPAEISWSSCRDRVDLSRPKCAHRSAARTPGAGTLTGPPDTRCTRSSASTGQPRRYAPSTRLPGC